MVITSLCIRTTCFKTFYDVTTRTSKLNRLGWLWLSGTTADLGLESCKFDSRPYYSHFTHLRCLTSGGGWVMVKFKFTSVFML